MSIKPIPPLLKLPDELFYCILDRLDTKDILFSFRNVCRHFHAITRTYNQYKIQITSTSSKADIHRMCQIIRAENITSLVLTNTDTHETSDRIRLFLSLIDIHQLTRLYSLDLFGLKACDLNQILHHIITVPTLMSLSLIMGPGEPIGNDTVALLSSNIATSNLRKLYLPTIYRKIYVISSPNQCKLEKLTIGSCTHRQLSDILHHLPNLRAFSSNNCSMDATDQIVLPTSLQLLTSLTLRSSSMLIDQLESLLSITPSLTYLHIVSCFSTFNFLQRLSQWEQFIRHKLPLLENFKFHVNIGDYRYENVQDIEPIISAFRTPFWLEQKRWYITCKYIKDEARSGIMLYSPADSSIDFPDNFLPGILSYSTSTTKNDDINKTSSTWSARLNLAEMIDAISSHQLNQPHHHIFHNMTQLALDVDWPINSFDLLSTLADCSQLTEIWLFLSNRHYFEASTMRKLLDLAYNVRTLGISYDGDSITIPEDIFSAISPQVEHLKVRTTYNECMLMVLERVEHLSSVVFVRDRGSQNSWTDIIEWLTERGRKFSQSDNHRSLQVWLGETSNELSEIEMVTSVVN